MNVILSAILPVGLIITVGFIAGKTLKLDQPTLSKLSVYILAPALVADSLYRTNVSLDSAIELLIGYTILSLILFFLVYAVCYGFKVTTYDRQSFLAIILCPNNGNLGLPFVTFALGEVGLEIAIIYMIGSSILLFIIAPAILKGEGFWFGLRLTFKLPLIWAMLAGIVLNWGKIELPFNLGKSLELLGAAAIPICLIILGMQLSTTRLQVRTREVLVALVKLTISPLIAYGVGSLIKLPEIDLQVFILQTAMPTAINSLIMVKEFGGNATMVARTIILSTLLSFITLPLVTLLIK
jgi:predicted permease